MPEDMTVTINKMVEEMKNAPGYQYDSPAAEEKRRVIVDHIESYLKTQLQDDADDAADLLHDLAVDLLSQMLDYNLSLEEIDVDQELLTLVHSLIEAP